MWAIGTYDHFLKKIKGQENNVKVNYFGVLFCDVRQSQTREYILNYLDVFNSYSGKYIDFYIPGYIQIEETDKKPDNTILIKDKTYIFRQKEYNDFCERFADDFSINFPFSSTLVLLEYKGGNFSTARKVIFQLEYLDKGIKSAGNFFLNIFNCAENGEMGQTLDKMLVSMLEKDMLFAGDKNILDLLGVDAEPILNDCAGTIGFRIR